MSLIARHLIPACQFWFLPEMLHAGLVLSKHICERVCHIELVGYMHFSILSRTSSSTAAEQSACTLDLQNVALQAISSQVDSCSGALCSPDCSISWGLQSYIGLQPTLQHD